MEKRQMSYIDELHGGGNWKGGEQTLVEYTPAEKKWAHDRYLQIIERQRQWDEKIHTEIAGE